MIDFRIELNDKINYVNSTLKKYMPEKCYPNILFESMGYSLFCGGKRLRPVMLLSACECLGGDISCAEPFACAIEMIHTYSLIHDDLPAIDNDDYRRGMLTNHKKFGEDIAILAGDGLLSLAMEVMSEAVVEKFGDMKYVRAMNEIIKGAGVYGMVGGQTVDVISEGKQIDGDTLNFIHKNKTAAMFAGALKAGAYLADADQKVVNDFQSAAEKLGVAFQIQDDILDVMGNAEKLGKPIGSDKANCKVTYVTMYGLENSSQKVKKLSVEAEEIFDLYNCGFLKSLTHYLINRDK